MNKKQLEARVADLAFDLRAANQKITILETTIKDDDYAKVKFELEAWSDAELAIIAAKAVAGSLSTNLFSDREIADSETCHAIILLLEDALRSMESGRVWD